MKRILLFIFFFIPILGICQLDTAKQSINFSPFRFEINSQTIHNSIEPKLVSLLGYTYFISNFGLFAEAEYGENLINDNCRNCADHLYGEGRIKEFNTGLGIKYQFGRLNQRKIQPYFSLLAYYSRLNYAGDFDGGWSGAGWSFNRTFNSVGGRLGTGLLLYPIDRLGLFYEVSLQMAYAKRTNNITKVSDEYGSSGMTFGKFGLCFDF